MKRTLLSFCAFVILFFGWQTTSSAASSPESDDLPLVKSSILAGRTQPLIIDHTTANINVIPQEWIEAAKLNLHIGYGHTSHGSQLTTGMSGLVNFANNGGRGLALPDDILQFDHNSNQGGSHLHLFEGSGYDTSGDLALDAGYSGWDQRTRDYLGAPDPITGRGTIHPEVNVIIWSWCGQASGKTEQTMLSDYLLPMNQLEMDYPGVTFVYMTGHADGKGEEGNLHLRNQQIRQYAIDNNKVLYDFYDFDIHDPDGNYYGDKAVDDELYYDSDGDGSRDKNWGLDWQNAHTERVDWYSVGCAHSQAINCNQKAYGAWWLWASLAGWNAFAVEPDLSPSAKTASQSMVEGGDTLTYTVRIINDNGPLTNSIHFSDTLPTSLAYIPGSLTATSGLVDDTSAPTLNWTGILSPTPAVTITYGVTVSVGTFQTITNTAIISSPGFEPIHRSTRIIVNGYQIYLPLVANPNRNPVHQGIATYYSATGDGACMFGPSPGDLMVTAMNAEEYDNAAYCGAYLQVTGPKGTVTVRVVDLCPECKAGHLDLSREAFSQIADLYLGRVDITWQLVSTEMEEPIAYHFKDGSNQWWTAVQIRNHRNPIAKVEYLNDSSQWVNVPRTSYNYFVQTNPGMGPGPYTFRVTDWYGNSLIDSDIPHVVNGTVNGADQFPPGL
jgi:uncharacterized repeat protein (TIGR01451 family)